MPRRSIQSAAERASLLLPPDTEDELIRHYAFGETDLSLIRQRREIINFNGGDALADQVELESFNEQEGRICVGRLFYSVFDNLFLLSRI